MFSVSIFSDEPIFKIYQILYFRVSVSGYFTSSRSQLIFFSFDTLYLSLGSFSNSIFAVHVCYLFLKHSADVSPSALQCRGEQAVGDAKHLWLQVKALHLTE